ncbi:MAG: MoxR family ATPase [Okeania sp. SIO2C2]|uniref:AAA family ATPase n=1 Tax=Okeania sp. SIO2C2 TaxID=2607787 RepID=UPI0013B60573|nr:MoxR family ATPase [Okeania sp. SIO2C2]NEP89249.1 MoxR family ATPase [Okeania sp. SIO2C2]
MNNLADRQYEGQGNDQKYEPLKDENGEEFPDIPRKKEPYIASKNLAEAVNDALYLRRPLLLEGEPGCGKTRLAYSIAYELGYPLKECYIRSTSRAEELLYTYDNIRRLYDLQEYKFIQSQLEEKQINNSPELTDAIERKKYVELGKLGEAIKLSAERDIPSVVLVDEIDKADIDFPNDLLLVLDRLQFEIKEVKDWKYDALRGEEREARKDFLPLIIITSNQEKELPKAFLRRCLFYYVDFPNEVDLRKIVVNHFKQDISPLFEVALNKFVELRGKISWRKKPSTGEFINWLRLLERRWQNEAITGEELNNTKLSQLPFLHTLVKNQSDRNAIEQLI